MSDLRFKVIEYNKFPINAFNSLAEKYEIIRDQVTGVSYLNMKNMGGATTVPLIDKDGKPWMDPEFQAE